LQEQPWAPPDDDDTKAAIAAAQGLFNENGDDGDSEPETQLPKLSIAVDAPNSLAAGQPEQGADAIHAQSIEPLEHALEELSSPRSDTQPDMWENIPRGHGRSNTWVSSHPNTKELVTEISDMVGVSLGVKGDAKQKKMRRRSSNRSSRRHSGRVVVKDLEAELVRQFQRQLALEADISSPGSPSTVAEQDRLRADIDRRVSELARHGARALLEDGEIQQDDLPRSEIMLEEELRRTLEAVARRGLVTASGDSPNSSKEVEVHAPSSHQTKQESHAMENFPPAPASMPSRTPALPAVTDIVRQGAMNLAGDTRRRLTFDGNLLQPTTPAQQQAARERARLLLAARGENSQPLGSQGPGTAGSAAEKQRLLSLPAIPHVDALKQHEKIAVPAIAPPPGTLDLPAHDQSTITLNVASGSMPAAGSLSSLTPISQQKREDHLYNLRSHVAPHLRPVPARGTELLSTDRTLGAVLRPVAPPPGLLGSRSAAGGLGHFRRAGDEQTSPDALNSQFSPAVSPNQQIPPLQPLASPYVRPPPKAHAPTASTATPPHPRPTNTEASLTKDDDRHAPPQNDGVSANNANDDDNSPGQDAADLDTTVAQAIVPVPKPLMSNAIARPMELLRSLLDLGRIIPAPGARADVEFQEQLDTLCFGVFPFISKCCHEASVNALDAPNADEIDADMLKLFPVVASVISSVARVATNPKVLLYGAEAVAALQSAALGALETKIQAVSHGDASWLLDIAQQLHSIIDAPALEARARALTVCGQNSNGDGYDAPHGDLHSLFRPLDVLAAKIIPAAHAANVLLGESSNVSDLAKRLVMRVEALSDLSDDSRTEILRALHHALQRVEVHRQRQELRDAAAKATRAEEEAEADFVYIEDDSELLDTLWTLFKYCSMHCDPLSPESVSPTEFCRLASLSFGRRPLRYHHTSSPAKQARQKRQRRREEAAAQRLLELPLSGESTLDITLPEVDVDTLHQHLIREQGKIRPDLLARYVVLRLLARPGRHLAQNALSFCEFIHALNVLMYRICTSSDRDIGSHVAVFYDDEFTKFVVHKDFAARLEQYVVPAIAPKCRKPIPLASLLQHPQIVELETLYSSAIDVLFQSYDESSALPAQSGDSTAPSLLADTPSLDAAQAHVQALRAISDAPSGQKPEQRLVVRKQWTHFTAPSSVRATSTCCAPP